MRARIASKPRFANGKDGDDTRRAWAIDLADVRQRRQMTNAADALLGAWVVEAHNLNGGIYHSYMVATVHLRPLPDKPPPFKLRPDMTHDFSVFGLHSEADLQLFSRTLSQQFIGRDITSPIITPPIYGAQVVLNLQNDTKALDLVEGVVKLMVQGELHPTPDSMSAWAARQDNMLTVRGMDYAKA